MKLDLTFAEGTVLLTILDLKIEEIENEGTESSLLSICKKLRRKFSDMTVWS